MHRLTCWVRWLLTAVDSDEASNWLQEHAAGRILRPAFDEACAFARCLALLFQCYNDASITMDSVRFFLDYRGVCPFRKAVRSVLKAAQPEPGWTPLKIESRKHVQACLQDAIRAAPTAAAAETQLAKLHDSVKAAGVELHPGVFQPLQLAMTQLPKLEKQLRQNRTAQLRTDLYGYIREMATKAGACAQIPMPCM